MSSGVVVLLGLIALASMVQTAFLAWMVWSGLDLLRWVERRQARASADMAAVRANLDRAQHNLTEVRGLYLEECDRALAAVHRIDQRVRTVREMAEPVIEGLTIALGLLHTVRGVYRTRRRRG